MPQDRLCCRYTIAGTSHGIHSKVILIVEIMLDKFLIHRLKCTENLVLKCSCYQAFYPTS